MSVTRCRREVSSSEFVRWMILFDEELEDNPPAAWLLLAQLTYWVYRLQFILGGTPQKTIEDFLPKPAGKVRQPPPVRPRQAGPDREPEPPTYDPPTEPVEEDTDRRMTNSKSAWESFMRGQEIMKAPPPPGGVIRR